MSTTKGVLANPFLIFGAAVTAFAGWLVHDTTRAPASQLMEPAPASATTPRMLPKPPTAMTDPIEVRLNTLRPGVPRLTAEQQLTSLPAPEVDPIDTSSGHPVFRERYRVNLGQPVALMGPAMPTEFSPGLYILTLEFDGSAPGHPLTRAALNRVFAN